VVFYFDARIARWVRSCFVRADMLDPECCYRNATDRQGDGFLPEARYVWKARFGRNSDLWFTVVCPD
jgi:hypothetical protein